MLFEQLDGANTMTVQFETQEWSLKLEDGRELQLLGDEKPDPFQRQAGSQDNSIERSD